MHAGVGPVQQAQELRDSGLRCQERGQPYAALPCVEGQPQVVLVAQQCVVHGRWGKWVHVLPAGV